MGRLLRLIDNAGGMTMHFCKILLGAATAICVAAVPVMAQDMSLSKGMGMMVGRDGKVSMMKPSAAQMKRAKLIRGDMMIIMGDDGRMYLYNGGPTGRQAPTH
jgi:hypothetical protein